MRIAMFTDSYYPTRDGVVTSLTTSRRILEEMGHKVIVFAPDDPHGKAPKEAGTYYLKSMEFSQYKGYRLAIYPSKGLYDIIAEHDIEVLHTHGVAFMGLKAMFASRFLKKPLMLTYHTMVTEASYYLPMNIDADFMRYLMWIYLRQFLKRSDSVVAPTQAILDELSKEAPLRLTAVIPTGIDLQRFKPGNDGSHIREKLGLGERKMVLHVGRVAMEKNLDLVIDGFKGVLRGEPDAVLLIAGDGPARIHYQARVREAGLEKSVHFAGFVPDAELPSYYAAADAFVIASKFETQGIVVMEALASGLPVAGINYRAIAEIVKDGGNGFLFSEEPGTCADAICKTLRAGDDIKGNAVETAKRFEQRACTAKLVEAYGALLEKSN